MNNTGDNMDKKPAAANVVGPWGDWCRCADCVGGVNGPVTVKTANPSK